MFAFIFSDPDIALLSLALDTIINTRQRYGILIILCFYSLFYSKIKGNVFKKE